MEEKSSDGGNSPAKGPGRNPHKTQKWASRKEFTKLSWKQRWLMLRDSRR